MKINKLDKLILKCLLWLLGGIIVAFISVIVASATSGINAWELFKNAVSCVGAFLIKPYSVLFLLIIGILLRMWRLNKKLNSLIEQKSKNEEEEVNELYPDRILILNILANSPDPMLEVDLYNSYHTSYPDNEMRDFRFVINDLIQRELIHHVATVPEGKEYAILGKGLNALENAIL